MSYFEMNTQEIAFFTVFAAFLKSRCGMINSCPYLVSSLSLISGSTYRESPSQRKTESRK